jgi:shikimate kinase
MPLADPDAVPDVRHVACIGLPGSGKAPVGRLAAERLGWSFVDVEELIESSTGSTVPELWEQGGEAAVSPLECALVQDVLQAFEHSVVATPGGVVLEREAARAATRRDVVVIYLRAGADELAQRLARDAGRLRPLADDGREAVMRTMFAARDEVYAGLADEVVQVDELTADQAASAVLHVLVGSVLRPGRPGA